MSMETDYEGYKRRMANVKRGRMTEAEKSEIERLAGSMKNPTPGKIAEKLNRHPSTVCWFLLTRNLITRVPGRAAHVYVRNGRTIYPFTEQHDAFIMARRVEGKSYKEIGRLVTAEFGIVRDYHSVHVRLVQLTAAPESADA